MSWSIAQLARMSKVTSRTLRHYDEIGLLRPAYFGSNGYRYYEREQLLRLQQILLFRELGLGLEEIGKTLDGQQDGISTLRRHHEWLLGERDRLARLANTVARTIEEWEGGDTMPAEDLFEGFDQAQYEDEVRERWGHTEAYAESQRKVAAMSKEDMQRLQADEESVCQDLAELLRTGVPVDDPRTQEVVDRHYRWFTAFWTPDAQTYLCIGNMYVDDARFATRYDQFEPGLAVYLRDAMAVYAENHL